MTGWDGIGDFYEADECTDCPKWAWLREPTDPDLCECGHHGGLPADWHTRDCPARTPMPPCWSQCAAGERDAAIRALEAVEAALTLDGRSSIRVVAAREAINDWRDGEAP